MPIQKFLSTTPGFYAYIIKNRSTNHPFHHHDFFQIFFVVKGYIFLQANGINTKITESEALIIPYDFHHRIIFAPESIVYSLYFTEEYIQTEIRARIVNRLIIAVKMDKRINMDQHLKLIVTFNEEDYNLYKSLFENLVKNVEINGVSEFTLSPSLISCLLRIISKAYLQMPFGKEKYSTFDDYVEIIRQCIEYINANYMEAINIDELSKKYAISKSLLNSLFLKLTGVTLKQYLTTKRIQAAKNLIETTDMSIERISEAVGYGEYSTFFRNFQKLTNKTPRDFRHTNS